MADHREAKEIYMEADPLELPENAFRELGNDEEYRPIMHPARDYAEVTPYSVTMGLVLAVIFSAAAHISDSRSDRCLKPQFQSPSSRSGFQAH